MPAESKANQKYGIKSYGFADIVDYIEQITYAIWNGPNRDPELIQRYYGPGTSVHTDIADIVGADALIDSTKKRLETFPDFNGIIADTIWTGNESDGYRTSMRWTWTATNMGPSAFGPATDREVQVSTIVNCVVQGEVIVQEWLCTNTLALAHQLGCSNEAAVVASEASNPKLAPGTQPSWEADLDGVALHVAGIWDAAFNRRDLSPLDLAYHSGAQLHRDIRPVANARNEIPRWVERWHHLCSDLVWTVDDAYWLPADGDLPERVAMQWTLEGNCRNSPVRITGISQHHISSEKIVQEWIEYDQLALLRQCGELI